jgi:hypothetical protein
LYRMEMQMPERRIFWVLFLFLPLLFPGCQLDPDDPNPDYPRIVIDTFTPPAFDENDTYLTLIDADGNVVAEDDNGNPDQTNHKGCSRIDYQGGLASGTYYIKVYNPTATGNPNYGIRVLDYDPGASFPDIAPANEDDGGSDDGVDGNGIPTSPVSIDLEEVLSRSIFPELTDVDWFELVLP